jgi:hypothetical protein
LTYLKKRNPRQGEHCDAGNSLSEKEYLDVNKVEWNGPAYNPRNGTLYVNAVDWCTTFSLTDEEIMHVPGARKNAMING